VWAQRASFQINKTNSTASTLCSFAVLFLLLLDAAVQGMPIYQVFSWPGNKGLLLKDRCMLSERHACQREN
jgi:hypothetical protein